MLSQQLLARSILLLVGCRDATTVQIFSTHTLSLPVGLNASIKHITSTDKIITSFQLNELETLSISVSNDDPSSVYVTSDKSLTVTLLSMPECSHLTSIGPRTVSCANSYAQLAPWFAWGRNYLVSSGPGGDGTADYLIQSGISSTAYVVVVCNNSTHTEGVSFLKEMIVSKNQHTVFRVHSRHYCSIESDQQIQMVQYSHRESNDGDAILIPPVEQYSNDYILPLLRDGAETEGFTLHASIFIPAENKSEIEGEGNRVIIDGQPILGRQYNAIYCRDFKLCGYEVEVELPLQSTVNVSHENPEVSFTVLVHRVGDSPFSYAAGSRLNDLTSKQTLSRELPYICHCMAYSSSIRFVELSCMFFFLHSSNSVSGESILYCPRARFSNRRGCGEKWGLFWGG